MYWRTSIWQQPIQLELIFKYILKFSKLLNSKIIFDVIVVDWGSSLPLSESPILNKTDFNFMRLKESLLKIQDPRRKEGMRHNLYQMFSMVILSGLCGHFGGRGVERFSKAHGKTFTDLLQLKHPVPSHTSFNTFLNDIPDEEFIAAFHNWTNSYIPLSEFQKGVSGDGKALKSTTEAHKGGSFQAVVTFFTHNSGLAHSISTYRNEKASEIHIVQFLMDRLKDMGITMFLDAVHCQKKQ